MATLEDFLTQFALTEVDKAAARRQALMTAGLGLLGARKGREGEAMARAGLLGMDAYNQGLYGAQQDKLGKYKLSQEWQKEQDAKKAKAEADAVKASVAGAFTPQSPLNAMGPGGPTPQNLQAVQAAASSGANPVEQYRRAAVEAARAGAVDIAKKYADIADAMEQRGEYSTTPQVGIGPDGKPVFAQFNKRGERKVAEGFTPPPDIQLANLNDRTIAIDKLTTVPGTTFTAGQSPDSKASTAVQWARLAEDRKRREADVSLGGVKPQWDAGTGQWVFPPTQDAPQGRAVVPQNYVGKADAKAVQSDRALAIIAEARKIIPKATGSYAGTGLDMAARVLGHATSGDIATGRLKALEAALMMNQPRMEGPQSNLDVQLYKQAAAEIGDPTVPRPRKMAALETVESLHKKYNEIAGRSPANPQAAGEVIDFSNLPTGK